MFDNPLAQPTAIVEALLILALAAGLGWLIARLLLNGRLTALQKDLADRQADLAECQAAKTRPVPVSATVAAPVVEPLPVVSAPTPVVEPLPVVTEPVLPAIDLGAMALPVVAAAAAVSPKTKGETEDDALARIASRANELNFDRIGLATAAEADDLKEIVGVGPFLERKLHSLGIYTFRQVANFDREDIDKVNDIIEFFPGRIDRDNWVAQSKVFYEKKYGGKA
jgi:predicted flap endonuclease-1-like 5' DNA nuclease